MNKWIQKSIKLSNSTGYLDELFEVYLIELGNIRGIPNNIQNEIKEAFETGNKVDLITKLLKLPKFPIDDPYIASLRRHPSLLSKNPETIERISRELFALGVTSILELVRKPKAPSRQLSHSFRNWLKTLNYPFLKEDDFRENNDIAFLDGGDKKLEKFAIDELNVKNLKKGIDFLLKIKNKYVLGEAKFLTDFGGHQNAQFNDAIATIKSKSVKAVKIAILDGILYIKGNNKMYKDISGKLKKENIMSALVLREFLYQL